MWESEVPMASLTRYRIGGPAERYARFGSHADLAAGLESLGGSAYRVLGWGANVLVSDRGVPEPVISLSGEFDYLEMAADTVDAGGAAGLPALVGDARREIQQPLPAAVGPRSHLVEGGQVLARHHEDMVRRLRCDVPDREELVVFEDHISGDVAPDYLAE